MRASASVRRKLFCAVILFGSNPIFAETDQRILEIMDQAMRSEEAAVSRDYSTKPVTVKLGPHRYVIPANYFGPKGATQPDFHDADQAGRYFGFSLFLPDFGGYTKDNWRDKFDHRLIKILRVNMVDKNRRRMLPNGDIEAPNPAAYGDPKARFYNTQELLESTPSLHAYGLAGYRPKHGRADVTWTGRRSNGEFFFFRCTLAPGDIAESGTYPLCDVRYYSDLEGLYVSYRYSNDQLDKWREIDDAVWRKLHAWEVKKERGDGK